MDSALISEVYPSGRLVSYHYDAASRVDRVANGGLSAPNSFASNITYTPHGAMASMRLGATGTHPGWTESWEFNNRLQPTTINVGAGVLSLVLSYCLANAVTCTTNNGNRVQESVTRGGMTWQNTATYDALNRLTKIQETSNAGGTAWSETYRYDRYGNRSLVGYDGVPSPTAEVLTASESYLSNNRVAAWDYADGRGNITAIPFMQRSYNYDAENRQTRATVNGVSATYAYDGHGLRIKKIVGDLTTTYVYDAFGRLAAEFSNHIVTGIGTTYRHIDQLGSTRLVVNENGIPVAAGCHDFRPFGQELLAGTDGRSSSCYPAAPASGLEFTGKEHDVETDLDYFDARYYSAPQGRFMSVDPTPLKSDKSNPQSWNAYAYTYNNPVRYVDRNGKWPTAIHKAILAGAFSGLSGTEVRILQRGSLSVDLSVLGQLAASRAHEHGMRDPRDTPEQASVKTDIFIFEHEILAGNARLASHFEMEAALFEMGKALHPVMDGTSPAHAGQTFFGIPSRPMLGTFGLMIDALVAWQHSKREAKITLEEYHKNIDLVRTEYLKTFGQEEFFRATNCKQVEGCRYDDSLLAPSMLSK